MAAPTFSLEQEVGAASGDLALKVQAVLRGDSLPDEDLKTAQGCYLKGLQALKGVSAMRAKIHFESALRIDSTFTPARLGLAAAQCKQKEYRAAWFHYADVLRAHPTNAPALTRVGMGVCCFQLKEFNHARKCFLRALQMDPGSVPGAIGLIAVCIELQRLDEAFKWIVEVYTRYPERHDAAQRYVDVVMFRSVHDGRLNEVAPALEKLLLKCKETATKASLPYTMYQLGRLHHALGRRDEARRCYQQSNGDVVLPIAHENLAKLDFLEGHYAECAEHIQKALEIRPTDSELLRMQAALLVKQELWEDAIQACKALTEGVGDGDIDAWDLRVWSYHHYPLVAAENLKQKIAICDGIGLETAMVDVVNEAALVQNADVLDAHTPDSKEAVKLDEIPPLFNLALCIEETEPEKAKDLYVSLVKTFPALPYPYIRLADMCFTKGDNSGGLRWLSLLQTARPTFAVPYAEIASRFKGKQRQAVVKVAPLDVAKHPLIAICVAEGFHQAALAPQCPDREKCISLAADRFLHTLRTQPDNVFAARGLAACAAAVKQFDLANRILLRVNEGDPNQADATRDLNMHTAHVMFELGLFSQAHDVYEKTPEPLHSEMMSACNFMNGKFRVAVEQVQKVMELKPDDVNTAYNCALVVLAHVVSIIGDDSTKVKGLTDEGEGSLLQQLQYCTMLLNRVQESTRASVEMKSFAVRCNSYIPTYQREVLRASQRSRHETRRSTTLSTQWADYAKRQKDRDEEERQAKRNRESNEEEELFNRTRGSFDRSRELLERWDRGEIDAPAEPLEYGRDELAQLNAGAEAAMDQAFALEGDFEDL